MEGLQQFKENYTGIIPKRAMGVIVSALERIVTPTIDVEPETADRVGTTILGELSQYLEGAKRGNDKVSCLDLSDFCEEYACDYA